MADLPGWHCHLLSSSHGLTCRNGPTCSTGAAPLDLLCIAKPRWPGAEEATVIEGPWKIECSQKLVTGDGFWVLGAFMRETTGWYPERPVPRRRRAVRLKRIQRNIRSGLCYEHTSASLLHMENALDLCDQATAALARVDLHAATPQTLALGALGIQRHIDRMKALHATVLTAADRALVWQGTGARNIADWLSANTNTSYGDAVGRKKLADSLEKSPELAEAVEKGEISAATAETLHGTIANPPAGADVGELINAVKGAGPRDAKAAVERWTEIVSSETDEEREERRYQLRSVRSSAPVDGLVTTTVVLPILQSRQFINAISHIAGKPDETDTRTTEQRLADGLVQLCVAYAKGQVTGGRERPTILITIPIESFTGDSNEPGTTANGDRIPAHIVRRLADNANLQRIMATGTHILELGRSVRYFTDDQYKALVTRDGGCRWPDCNIPAAWCEIDHLIPDTNGGPTDLDNAALWCCHHHHVKHRPGVQVLGNAHNLRIRLPDGTIIDCATQHTRRAAAAA